MAAPEHQEAPQPGASGVQLKLYFRPLAWAGLAAFIATLVIGGIVTFTATEYTKETDLVFRFYNTFHPCIFFDHYPAKAVTAIGIDALVSLNIGFGILTWLHAFTTRSIETIGNASIMVGFYVIMQMVLVNVFTTPLYPEADIGRRLHGGEGEGSPLELTAAQLHIFQVHTSFYLAWVLGNLVFAWHIYCYMKPVRRGPALMVWSVALAIGGVALFLHAAGMAVTLLLGTGLIEDSDIESQTQLWAIKAIRWTYVGLWGWVLCLFFQFFVHPEVGVSITFHGTEGDAGTLRPKRVVGESLKLLALVATLGAFFHPKWEDDTTTAVPLAAALRSKPFGYIVAPLWIGLSLRLAAGLGLTLMHFRLRDGRWPRLVAVAGGGLAICTNLSWLVVVDSVKFSWVFFAVAIVCFVVWVLSLGTLKVPSGVRGGWLQIAYATCVLVLAIGSTVHFAFCIPLAFSFCFYDTVVQDTALSVSVSPLGAQEESPVDSASPAPAL